MAKNLSGKKWSHKWAVVRCCVLPTCLKQLHYQNYLSVSREQRILQSNWWKIEMQYAYHISTRQLSVVTYPRHDFPEKHISCKMLNSAPFFSLWRRTDLIQWIPCVHLLVWFFAETRKKNSLEHIYIQTFSPLLATNKTPWRSLNIP